MNRHHGRECAGKIGGDLAANSTFQIGNVSRNTFDLYGRLDDKDKGGLLLDADLTDVLGDDLPAGDYNFTFFGIAEAAPPPLRPPAPTASASAQKTQATADW